MRAEARKIRCDATVRVSRIFRAAPSEIDAVNYARKHPNHADVFFIGFFLNHPNTCPLMNGCQHYMKIYEMTLVFTQVVLSGRIVINLQPYQLV